MPFNYELIILEKECGGRDWLLIRAYCAIKEN